MFLFATLTERRYRQNKNPTAVWQWGSINLVNESEPDRRAAQQQRV
jgi:hypothetical protein